MCQGPTGLSAYLFFAATYTSRPMHVPKQCIYTEKHHRCVSVSPLYLVSIPTIFLPHFGCTFPFFFYLLALPFLPLSLWSSYPRTLSFHQAWGTPLRSAFRLPLFCALPSMLSRIALSTDHQAPLCFSHRLIILSPVSLPQVLFFIQILLVSPVSCSSSRVLWFPQMILSISLNWSKLWPSPSSVPLQYVLSFFCLPGPTPAWFSVLLALPPVMANRKANSGKHAI